MEHSAIFAGFGGQGVLFAGTILARAAMAEGLEVLWIPSYGPEMRGGTASCTVIVSDEAIGSPVVDRADAVVALNPPSMAKFEPAVAPGGLLVLNRSLIEALPSRTDLEVCAVPCTALARTAGDDRLVSVVAVGALLARRPLVPLAAVRAALAQVVGAKHPERLAADLAALDAGYAAALEGVAGPA
ncbi:MAG TPA: 2-oxoacid:acceptor oxidoreductase family protein [Candidatus Sulfomarinibacteraceae bacterium]|nr:2-oxoacid:acceptor oxidoreductase family protein [Candidatus Sulfomarinibacteraceae bacterium]